MQTNVVTTLIQVAGYFTFRLKWCVKFIFICGLYHHFLCVSFMADYIQKIEHFREYSPFIVLNSCFTNDHFKVVKYMPGIAQSICGHLLWSRASAVPGCRGDASTCTRILLYGCGEFPSGEYVTIQSIKNYLIKTLFMDLLWLHWLFLAKSQISVLQKVQSNVVISLLCFFFNQNVFTYVSICFAFWVK